MGHCVPSPSAFDWDNPHHYGCRGISSNAKLSRVMRGAADLLCSTATVRPKTYLTAPPAHAGACLCCLEAAALTYALPKKGPPSQQAGRAASAGSHSDGRRAAALRSHARLSLGLLEAAFLSCWCRCHCSC